MVPWMFTVFVSSSSSAAAATERAPPDKCSLNGYFDDVVGSQRCICDPPWTGIDCSKLDVMHVSPLNQQGYGVLTNQTTWGASIIQYGCRQQDQQEHQQQQQQEQQSQYHMYVSVMKYGSTLRSWTTTSEIHHAISISGTPEGPYIFQDVAIPVLSHNPRVVLLEDGQLAMFHIFNGVTSYYPKEHDDVLSPSSSSSSSPQTFSSTASESRPDRRSSNFHLRRKDTIAGGRDGGSTIHLADSPYGPWRPLYNNTLGKCNNPAPFVVFASCERSHVIYIVCRGGGKDSGIGGTLKGSNTIYGPWEVVSQIEPVNNHPSSSATTTTTTDHDVHSHSHSEPQRTNFNLEDPTLWIDSRGFHILYHAYVYDRDEAHRGKNCTGSVVSAYVYSSNGKDWYYGNHFPYGNKVEISLPSTVFTSTSPMTATTLTQKQTQTRVFATRERPSLIFQRVDDEDHDRVPTLSTNTRTTKRICHRTTSSSSSSVSTLHSSPSTIRLTHLVTGVCSTESCTEGPPGGCVNCKYDHWDFTLIQPLRI